MRALLAVAHQVPSLRGEEPRAAAAALRAPGRGDPLKEDAAAAAAARARARAEGARRGARVGVGVAEADALVVADPDAVGAADDLK